MGWKMLDQSLGLGLGRVFPAAFPAQALVAAQLVNHHTISLARVQLHNSAFCAALDAIEAFLEQSFPSRPPWKQP